MRPLIILTLFSLIACTPSGDRDLLEELMLASPKMQPYLDKAETYEIQILYTQIDRDENNRPSFTSHSFRLDSTQYFYPASTVKMPAAILAMEKINQLSKTSAGAGLTIHTPLRIDSARVPQIPVVADSTSENGLPSIAHYARKIFVVSNNDAHNRLYEFLGQDYFNDQLHTKGYDDTKIVHRLGGEGVPFGVAENRYTNAFTFYSDDPQQPIYQQSEVIATNDYSGMPIRNTLKGKGYKSNGELINEPKDFSTKNFFPLHNMQDILKAVLFPEAVPEQARFDLAKADYPKLYKWMGMKPRESRYPDYSIEKEADGSDHFYDSYVKFFMFGTSKDPMPENIRIFNKVGWAYGYLTDCSYVVDFDKNVEFLLAATIHVNENQIYNDDTYEYETVGLPFFEHLGQLIYDFEVKRERATTPDLSRFRVDFDERTVLK
ncbi:MAG: serine hydrolase [Bacteroidota bacterium]